MVKDLISDLPDHLLHKILSYLPSTREAVKSGVLSKRWQYLWTSVPDLIFDFNFWDKDIRSFSKFVNSVLILNSCSKINKFIIEIKDDVTVTDLHSQISLWILFAARKQVEQLILKIPVGRNGYSHYYLPQFFNNNASVIEMNISVCNFISNGNMINWRSLKVLALWHTVLTNLIIENILSSSPLLESLVLVRCFRFGSLHITSNCLKSLVISDDGHENLDVLNISATYLENLELLGRLEFAEYKFINIPNLVSVTLGFVTARRYIKKFDFVKQLLYQVRHVGKLTLGIWFIQVLAMMELTVPPCPLSICTKCLILDVDSFISSLFGTAMLLPNFVALEKLVIKLSSSRRAEFDFNPERSNFFERYLLPEETESIEKYRRMYKTKSNSLLHLKTIEILGFNGWFGGYEFVFEFIEFLLENADALEKMVIFDGPSISGTSKKRLLRMPRSSPHALVIFPK